MTTQIELPTNIQANDLILRPFIAKDAPDLLTACQESHEGLNSFYGGVLSQKNATLEQIQNYIKNCATEKAEKTFIQYGVFDKKDGRLLGAGSLHHLDWPVPKGRIGYWVRQTATGRGLATTISNILTRLAFDKLSFKRLEIRTATHNPASAAIPKKLGYHHLCVFEKNKVGNNGELWDLDIWVRFNQENLPDISFSYES